MLRALSNAGVTDLQFYFVGTRQPYQHFVAAWFPYITPHAELVVDLASETTVHCSPEEPVRLLPPLHWYCIPSVNLYLCFLCVSLLLLGMHAGTFFNHLYLQMTYASIEFPTTPTGAGRPHVLQRCPQHEPDGEVPPDSSQRVKATVKSWPLLGDYDSGGLRVEMVCNARRHHRAQC
jgi:hypothetical protein